MIGLRYLARRGRVEVIHWEIRDGWYGRGREARVDVCARSWVPCWLVTQVACARLGDLQRRRPVPPTAFRLTEWAAGRDSRRDTTDWRLVFEPIRQEAPHA